MNPARPDPAQERWLALAARYPGLRASIEAVPTRTGGWQSTTWLSRCLSFGLGLLAAAMILGALAWLPGRLLWAGAAMLAVAEWLIRARRHFRLGLEEALWTCGAVTVAFELQALFALHESGQIAALVALTLLLAGLRLLNALLTSLAALLASVALAAGTATLVGWSTRFTLASVACGTAALVALAAGRARLRRPSHDRMLDGLVLALPLAAFGWATAAAPQALGAGADPYTRTAAWLPPLLALGLGAACLAAGLSRRRHAPLLAALGCLVALAWGLREVGALALHTRLLLWGTLALLVSVALERWLREPRGGFTSRSVAGDETALDGLQSAAAVLLAPRASAAAGGDAQPGPGGEPQAGGDSVDGGGGSFAGGGATGRF